MTHRVPGLLLLVASLAAAGPALAKDAAPTLPRVDPKGGAPTLPREDAKADALASALAVEDSLVKAIASVRESSVTVFHLKREKAGGLVPAGMGSGVVYVAGGKPYVLTNEHVVKDAHAIEVRTVDGATHRMKKKDGVPQYDIAFLEFEKAPAKALKGARLGKSQALLEGQWVVATGNPFFLATDGQPVATLGVVSGLDRVLPGEFSYPNAIQHDAEVNPGNSGGPLWNLDGELVGINGKIATRSGPAGENLPACNTGASFSIPIHLVNAYLRTFLDDKVAAKAGYAGITLESVEDGSGQPVGAKVTKVASDCPCTKGATGVKVGDVLVRIGVGSGAGAQEHDVRTKSDYENLIATLPAGAKVRLTYLRDKKRLSWSGELAAQK